VRVEWLQPPVVAGEKLSPGELAVVLAAVTVPAVDPLQFDHLRGIGHGDAGKVGDYGVGGEAEAAGAASLRLGDGHGDGGALAQAPALTWIEAD